MKLLFVCSRNRKRSLTAETIFADLPGHQVRSAGSEQSARVRVTEGAIGWADLIFVMEKRHLERMRQRFPSAIDAKPVVCLHILDEYEYMDEDLIDRLRGGVEPYLEADADD